MKNTNNNLSTYFLIIISMLCLNLFGQHKYAEWYTTFDPLTNSEGSNFNNIVSDGESIFANGTYTYTGTFQGVELPQVLDRNAIITKMNLNGEQQWITTMTGDGIDAFFDMVLDSEGNVVLTGWSSSSTIEINGESVIVNPVSFSNSSIVVKLSGDDGSLIWINYFHSSSYTAVNSIRMSLDDNNNVYVGGYYSSDFTVDTIDVSYNQSYGNDIFILKFDSAGIAQWVNTIEGVSSGGYSSPKSLVVFEENLFVGFDYSKPFVVGDSTLPYEGSFYWNGVTKMDSESGEFLSVKVYGMDNSDGYQNSTGLEQDSEGNLVIVGYFSGAYPLEGDDFSIIGEGNDDGYIIKLDNDLNTIWAKASGGIALDRIFNIEISEDDDIFLNGGFDNTEPFIYDGVEVLEANSPGSISNFELILNSDGTYKGAYGLYGTTNNTVLTFSDAVFVNYSGIEYLYCVGNLLNEVEFIANDPVISGHNLGYVYAWDISDLFGSGDDDCEGFDELTAGGYVAEQLGGLWTTWSNTPGGADDALVSDAYSYSGNNSMLVDGSADMVQLFDVQNITSGVYQYNIMIYVPTGTTGYFNLQKDLIPGTEWGFQVMFEDDGLQYIDGNGAAAVLLPFEYDTWINCEMIVDLDIDWMQYFVDGELVHEYQWTLGTFGTPGASTLGGANFYANAGATGTPPGAHFDDVCFRDITPEPCENFDSLVSGTYVAEQLGGLWTTWSGTPGGADDAPVVDDMASSAPNAFTVNDVAVDLVRQFGNNPIDGGQWLYSHMMYVPAGYSGYFNVQSEPTPGVDWVVEFFFDDGGTGSLVENGITSTFFYPQDIWIAVEVNFDLDSDMAELLFNGYVVHQWVSEFTIGGIDYWGSDSGGAPGAYFDDVCFEPGWLIDPPVLDPPSNLEANIVDENISLSWDAPGGGSGIEELIYDNNISTDKYAYNGFTMSTHMSPASTCKVLTLRFHASGTDGFNATIFGWDGTQPGTTILHEELVMVADEGWLDVDVSDENIIFNSDFTVGFGSINNTAYLSYDGGLNNGRSWDYDNLGNWSIWSEAYLIRAVVEYSNGSTEEIGSSISNIPVTIAPGATAGPHPTDYSNIIGVKPIDNISLATDDLLGYNVYYQYANGGFDFLEYTTETEYLHEGMALTIGLHEYYVTAVYDEGETEPSNQVAVSISGMEEFGTKNLKIFPNPAMGIVNIHADKNIQSIVIFNNFGQVVADEIVGNNTYSINISSYNPGIYLLQIETDSGSITHRIIVQ